MMPVADLVPMLVRIVAGLGERVPEVPPPTRSAPSGRRPSRSVVGRVGPTVGHRRSPRLPSCR
jgi:hypothetical protein